MEPPPYVSRADGDVIEVRGAKAGAFADLGFKPAPGQPGAMIRTVAGDEDKATVFAGLRDAGVCFSGGREWNPADVFEWLRERGLLAGPFTKISWTGPGQFFFMNC